jgi:hypothetical protein
VTTLLVDGNLDGHAGLLLSRLTSEDWKLFSDHLGLQILLLEDVGLDRESPDDDIWRFCQANSYYLLTDNRNMESEVSLEATIRREGTSESLPVFTLADAKRLYQSPEYLEKVVDSLLDRLLSAANYLGAGRVYLP